ncbi:MAG: hypothetical protein AAF666_10610 [Pseudomonadota bacterium]
MPARVPIIAGCLLLSLALGTVHVFSVLLAEIEAALGASRGAASLTYSFALMSLTVAVTFGHRAYHLLPGWGCAVVVVGIAVLGLVLAAGAGRIWVLWLGFGLIFGAANGLGYGYALQLSAQVWPGREGLAMGLVTAAYAIGATVAPPFLEAALAGGLRAALLGLATAIGCAGLLAAMCLSAGKARFLPAQAAAAGPFPWPAATGLWCVYGAAVLAGLMAIGHATEIARELGGGPATALLAPSVIAICNMAGSLVGGAVIDRFAVRPVAVSLPLMSTAALLWLAMGPGSGVLAALGLIGATYGATIAAYPALIARRYGVAAGARIYGVVFTAWGAAGLIGPLGAGAIFDRVGGYETALVAAAGFATASAVGAALRRH